MRVFIYRGALRLVEKSGVGQAIFHQENMLRSMGISAERHFGFGTEIVHINTVFPDSLLIALLAKACRKKVIYYGHSTMEDFRNSFKGSDFWAPLFQKWIRLCYGRGDLVITPTEYSKALLESYKIQRPIVALSNGVDTDFFLKEESSRKAFREKYRLEPEEKAVLCVGHYIERKGILEFIRLAEQMPDVRFFWFGYTNRNMIPEEINRAIRTAPDNLTFPGYVSREELREAYCGCDLFAFMSFEETEGIVVLEALSCEIPVLLRNIPVYDGWLTDGKNVYKAETEADFLALSRKILEKEMPDLTEEGRKTAEERSIHRIGEKLLERYQAL